MYHCLRLLFLSTLVIFAVNSCKQKDKDPSVDCGCDGPTVRTVQNVKASYLGNGYFALDQKDQHGNLTYGWACKIDTSWEKSIDQNTFGYLISADFKTYCPNPDDMFVLRAPGSPFNITAIKKE